jgi:hypothetical protein
MPANATKFGNGLEHTGFTPVNKFAFDVMGRGWGGKIGERLDIILSSVD